MPTSPIRHPSTAARMRLHRQRELVRLACLTVEIRDSEIAALVRKGILEPDKRRDGKAVRKAMYSFLDPSLRVVA